MRVSTILLVSTTLVLFSCDDSRFNPRQAHAQVSTPRRYFTNYAGITFYYDRSGAGSPETPPYLFSSGDGVVHRPVLPLPPPPVISLPFFNNDRLRDEEQQSEDRKAGDGVYQFGKAFEVSSLLSTEEDISTLSLGRWVSLRELQRARKDGDMNENTRHQYTYRRRYSQQQHQHHRQKHGYEEAYGERKEQQEREDVMVWQLEIHSESARSLNLLFSEFILPPESEFYVSGKDHILGAFTSINNKADKSFATAPLAGNRLLLEYYIPKRLLDGNDGEQFPSGMPRIQLSHVVHPHCDSRLRYTRRIQDSSAAGAHSPWSSISRVKASMRRLWNPFDGFQGRFKVLDLHDHRSMKSSTELKELASFTETMTEEGSAEGELDEEARRHKILEEQRVRMLKQLENHQRNLEYIQG